MNFWVITDTHFGHGAMHEMCGRPKGFEFKILNNLKQMVKPEDVLIHLGDISWYKDEYWTRLLREYVKGKMWLTIGNHDKRSMTWYLSHGWDAVAESFTLKIYGKTLIFSHKPMTLPDTTGVLVNIHGHLHNTEHHPEYDQKFGDDTHKLLAIENTNYQPVPLRGIVERGILDRNI